MNKENNGSENDDKKIDNQEVLYIVRTNKDEIFVGKAMIIPNEYTLLTLRNALLIETLPISELVRISQDGKLRSFVLASRIPKIYVMPDLIIPCSPEAICEIGIRV